MFIFRREHPSSVVNDVPALDAPQHHVMQSSRGIQPRASGHWIPLLVVVNGYRYGLITRKVHLINNVPLSFNHLESSDFFDRRLKPFGYFWENLTLTGTIWAQS
jgi:hypothetical protein